MSDKKYEVGYGKPPKASQFKKGQSGKPSGRSKGSKNVKTRIQAMLETTSAVRLGDETRQMDTYDITLLKLREKALGGDARAMQKIFDLAHEIETMDTSAASSESDFAVEDEAIVLAYIQKREMERAF
jgi:hypothetical protein